MKRRSTLIHSNTIDISHNTGSLIPDREIRRIIVTVWRLLRCDARKRSLSVVWVGSASSQRFNGLYRGKDASTNVLSFEYGMIDGKVSSEIVLCSNVIRREAHESGIPIKDYAARLLIHGVLHTEGFLHDTVRHRKLMETQERKLMASCGYDASLI